MEKKSSDSYKMRDKYFLDENINSRSVFTVDKDSSLSLKVRMSSNFGRYIWDHPYITSAKRLGGWGQKNGIMFSTIYTDVG